MILFWKVLGFTLPTTLSKDLLSFDYNKVQLNTSISYLDANQLLLVEKELKLKILSLVMLKN